MWSFALWDRANQKLFCARDRFGIKPFYYALVNGRFYFSSEIKQILQTWVDQTLDHRMILHEKDPLRAALEKAGEPIFILKANPTAESIARLIFETAQAKGLPVTSVTLWETPNSFATYTEEKN